MHLAGLGDDAQVWNVLAHQRTKTQPVALIPVGRKLESRSGRVVGILAKIGLHSAGPAEIVISSAFVPESVLYLLPEQPSILDPLDACALRVNCFPAILENKLLQGSYQIGAQLLQPLVIRSVLLLRCAKSRILGNRVAVLRAFGIFLLPEFVGDFL